jgi:hypothetical protein
MSFINMLLTTPEGAGALLGSFAGLVALVAAALFNAHLERKARAGVIIANRNSLTTALKAEVCAYRDLALRRKIHLDDSITGQKTLLSSTGMPVRRLFDANASVIGLLDSGITDDVARFYFKLEDLELYLKDTENYVNSLEDIEEKEYENIKGGISDQWEKMSNEASKLIEVLSQKK